MSKNTNEYLTAAKIAKLYGLTPSDVKKALKTINAKPVVVKGGCYYYSLQDSEKVKKLLKK